MVGANPHIASIVLAEGAHKVAYKPLVVDCIYYLAVRRDSPEALVPASYPNVVLAVLVYSGNVCIFYDMAQLAAVVSIKTAAVCTNPQAVAAVASHRLYHFALGQACKHGALLAVGVEALYHVVRTHIQHILIAYSLVAAMMQRGEHLRTYVKLYHTLRAYEVKHTLAVARYVANVVAEQRARIARLVAVYMDRIAVVAVESDACGYPQHTVAVGVYAVDRYLRQSVGRCEMVEVCVLRVGTERYQKANQCYGFSYHGRVVLLVAVYR